MNPGTWGNERSVAYPAQAEVDAAEVGEPGEVQELQRAAEQLYRENYEFVWRNARRLGASDDWVDDAVHEVFLVATRRLAEFEGRSSARTWLFAITFRLVQRLRRDRARQRSHAARYVREAPPGVADAARQNEAAEYLRYLLSLLPEAQRVVLILAELEGFSSAAVAESLGIPAGTVDSRLRAARAHLARVIERERAREERWTNERG
jgi:RNA polymerase sigma-70 factor, ECF subfamily